MDKSIRTALEAKFSNEAVKKRRGSFGKEICYVEGGAVVARLNDCFDGEWSFVIVEHRVLDTGEILVHGRLSVLGIVKEAFGKSAPPVNRETGEVLSEADSFKAASTDALKKAATLLGVAAYLYSDDITDAPEEKPADEKPAEEKPVKPTGDRRERLTQKQLSAIWSMGRGLKLSAEAVRKRSVEMFNVQPEQLLKSDASAFISKLGEEMDKRRAA